MLSSRLESSIWPLIGVRHYMNQQSQTFQVGAYQSGPHTLDCSLTQVPAPDPVKFICYRQPAICAVDDDLNTTSCIVRHLENVQLPLSIIRAIIFNLNHSKISHT